MCSCIRLNTLEETAYKLLKTSLGSTCFVGQHRTQGEKPITLKDKSNHAIGDRAPNPVSTSRGKHCIRQRKCHNTKKIKIINFDS